DAGHVLRPRGHDRRGQGGQRHREDRPPGSGRDPGRTADRRDPGPREVQARRAGGRMRADGTFIAVEVDDAVAADAGLARKLTEVCPVDIFAVGDGGGLELVDANLDECVLCRLCLDATPEGSVKVIKLYDDSAVLA